MTAYARWISFYTEHHEIITVLANKQKLHVRQTVLMTDLFWPHLALVYVVMLTIMTFTVDIITLTH